MGRSGKIRVTLKYGGRAKPPDDPNPEGSCQDCNRLRLMLIRNMVCPDCGEKAQAGWNINRYGVWCDKCQRWHDPER
jgi:hypothetical protein